MQSEEISKTIMGNGGSRADTVGKCIDQRELNAVENKLKERDWRIVIDGFLRSHKISDDAKWEIGLNHMIFEYIVAESFMRFNKSNCKKDTFSSSGMNFTLHKAKQHALYLDGCVGFTYEAKQSVAWFHRSISASDLENNPLLEKKDEEIQLYVLKSFCDELFVFFNDSLHSGNDLHGSGMAYNLDEAKEYGMRLKNCKGFTFDTWRPERKDKQGVAWFHSVVNEEDTKGNRRYARPSYIATGSQCLYVKKDYLFK